MHGRVCQLPPRQDRCIARLLVPRPESLDRGSHLAAGERRNMTYVRELLMQSKCVDCADSRLVVLDFDHVGEKAA